MVKVARHELLEFWVTLHLLFGLFRLLPLLPAPEEDQLTPFDKSNKDSSGMKDAVKDIASPVDSLAEAAILSLIATSAVQ